MAVHAGGDCRGGAGVGIRAGASLPIRFAHAHRQQLVSTLPTNGKVEPFEWQAVARGSLRSGEPGGRTGWASRGAGRRTGAAVGPLPADRYDAAEAKVAEARANLAAAQAGAKPSELADIQNSLSAQMDLQQQQND